MNTKKNYIVWMDLEMTGLQPENNVILEIATIITDANLKIIDQGPVLVIHQPDSVLENMEAWPKEHHEKSGLTESCRNSNITTKQAEQETLNFIKKYCQKKKGILAGNSIWQDRNFLIKEMPNIIDYLHYRLLDVTAVKELVRRWYPDNPFIKFTKNDIHRAKDDVIESINELRHYRKHFFQ